MKNIVIILFVSLSAMSCALVSEKECITRSWYKQAIEDAKAGKPKSTFGDYKQSCARYGIEIDQEEYAQGYEKGLTL